MPKVQMGTAYAQISDANVSNIRTKIHSHNTNLMEGDDELRRMRRTDFQARLGRKLDNIRKRVLDNNIRLSAHPTDMLRIAVVRDDRSHDLISRTIESAEIMPIILPKMEDIPLRHLIREGKDVLIPSMYPIQQEEYFEVYAPVQCDLHEDDLLVRILYDSSPDISNPYVMVLQVKDLLGTFGYSTLTWKKAIVTFYDESLPQRVVQLIKSSILKREALDW